MSIIRTVVVTTTKTIKVELPDEYDTDEFKAMWCRELWDIEGVDDIAKYAAEMAAYFGSGMAHDGIGLLSYSDSTDPRKPDTKFDLVDDETESELVETK